MENVETRREAWVACAVAKLRAVRSWTGRLHVHKLLVLAKMLKLANPPFDFALYHYGPYSYELDGTFAMMEAYGRIYRHYERPDYGPRYSLPDGARPKLSPRDDRALDRVANWIGKRPAGELEAVATALWIRRIEGAKTGSRCAERLKQVKPHYDPSRIQSACQAAAELERAFASKEA